MHGGGCYDPIKDGTPGHPGAAATVSIEKHPIVKAGDTVQSAQPVTAYDGQKYLNVHYGSSCEGGDIVEEDGVWVVAPGGNATAVRIENLPEGAAVAGVRIGDYVIPSAAFMGFGTGENANVFSLALDPADKAFYSRQTRRLFA